MFKTQKMFSLIIAVCLCFSSIVPCIAADENTQYATREYIISEFVQSVGRNTLDESEAVLDMIEEKLEEMGILA